MEEYSDLEHIAGSPTAGESGFVHVESIDSASMDGSSINQDDGVVVTRVDNTQDESSNLRMTEDGGNEEFVDCPDDLLSYDGRSDIDESQEAEVVSEGQQHSLFASEREILPHHYQEERRQLITELTNLRHQLKALIKKQPLIGGLFTDEPAVVTVMGDEKSLLPLHEMINDCSRFIEVAYNEQSQTEGTIRELYSTLDLKDREIEGLNVKVIQHSSLQTTTDRILSSLLTTLGEKEFPDTSVSGKLTNLEKRTSLLMKKFNHFLSEVSILNQCLAEVKSDSHTQTDPDKVLSSVREELLELKRKELQLVYRNSHLENEYMKVMQELNKGRQTIEILNSEIGKLKGEVEVEKTRYSNTREKLNLAVTKGKSLVQQRDSLKQAITEKTSELDQCLIELQEKSSSYIKLQDEIYTMEEAARVKIDRLTVSLIMEAQEKNYLEDGFADLTHGKAKVFEELHVLKDKNGSLQIDFQRSEDKAALLREKLSMAVKKGKGLVQERESVKQQIVEKNAHIEALNLELKQKEATLNDCRDQMNKLSSDLLHSKEEKNAHIEALNLELKQKEATLNDCRDQMNKLSSDLLHSKEEKNAHIEALNLELKQKEATMNDCRDQMNKLSSDLLHSKEERDQIEQFLVESNTILQKVIEATDEIVLPVDTTEPVEKVKKCVAYLNEYSTTVKSLEDTVSQLQNDRNLFESEIKKLKDEVAYHEHKFMDASVTIKTLEDDLLKANNNVSNLVGEKKNDEQELSTKIEELQAELEKSKEQNEGTVSQLQHNIILFESEIKKLKDEVAYHEHKFMDASETIKTLEDDLLKANNIVSNLVGEKGNDEQELSTKIEEIQAELEKSKEQNDMLQNKVIKLETELEASQTLNEKMGEDYREKEDEWIRREAELSKQLIDKDQEAEDGLMQASEVKSLFNKMNGITIPFPNVAGDVESYTSDPVKKLFYIVDSVNELVGQITLLSHAKQELHLSLSKQELEAEHLKEKLEEAIKDKKEFEKMKKELYERGVTEASSPLPPRSEISEVEDPVSTGKRSIPVVPYAAHVRTLRKGSNDYLAININPEADKQETDEDKGHIFKSLHTSGLVPPQGKIIADRLDGIWVSGGRALMSRPRARVGLIAYWVVVHIWLLGTLL